MIRNRSNQLICSAIRAINCIVDNKRRSYYDNKKFNGYWQKNSKKKTYTVKKLDKKTKYYFKVRAYVINGNKKLYGSYSKVKSITVKK